MQQKFFELLQEENAKGATILFSSHILSEVQKLCNRVAIIKEGKIIKLEKMSTLTENKYKSFKLELDKDFDMNFFNIAGVSSLEKDNEIVTFLFKGNINKIMKKISEVEIKNLWIEEPSLEEIFMHYYEKEE
jgi:ABC-2 type transport system ATP-binding protein